MTPERWSAVVDDVLAREPIGVHTVPDYWESRGRTTDRETLLAEAPWLPKEPVTNELYGLWDGGLDLGHFTDEMVNALRAEEVGLPNDLAVRPDALARMSFPQAVERVGRINQWRAKQMEEAAQQRLSSPAVQMFKEYPDDPGGLRWVELRQPEPGEHLLDPDELASYREDLARGDAAPPEVMDPVFSERAQRPSRAAQVRR